MTHDSLQVVVVELFTWGSGTLLYVRFSNVTHNFQRYIMTSGKGEVLIVKYAYSV